MQLISLYKPIKLNPQSSILSIETPTPLINISALTSLESLHLPMNLSPDLSTEIEIADFDRTDR